MAILNANKRVVCPVCTTDPDQPVLVDGVKWEMHERSRGHRRMTAKDKRASRHLRLENRSTRVAVDSEGSAEA